MTDTSFSLLFSNLSFSPRMWKSLTCALGLLAISFLSQSAVAQQATSERKPPTERELELMSVRGKWAMYPRETGATPPDPPPPNASYKEAAKLKPFASIPRLQVFLTEGRLFGEVVFPDGIVLRDDNQDVTGKEAVPISDVELIDGTLSFKAQVEGELVEAEVKADRRRLLGTWKSSSGKSGSLFLVKRIF